MLGERCAPFHKPCSRVGLKWFVPRKALTRLVEPLHVDVVGAHRVGQVVAVVVCKAGVPECDNLSYGVVAPAALWDPYVTGFAPAGL